METLTFLGYWLLIALGGTLAHWVMCKRIDAEIEEEERDA